MNVARLRCWRGFPSGIPTCSRRVVASDCQSVRQSGQDERRQEDIANKTGWQKKIILDLREGNSTVVDGMVRMLKKYIDSKPNFHICSASKYYESSFFLSCYPLARLEDP